MIASLVLRILLLIFAMAALTLVFEFGRWLATQTGVNWFNAGVIAALILLTITELRRNAFAAFDAGKNDSLGELAFNFLFWAALILVLNQHPQALGATQWPWTHLQNELAYAYQYHGRFGRALYTAWSYTSVLALLSLGASILCAYFATAPLLGLPSPAQSRKPTREETLYQANDKLIVENARLSKQNQNLDVAAKAAEAEAIRATKALDEAEKRQQALRQELVSASVTLERAQNHLRDQNLKMDLLKSQAEIVVQDHQRAIKQLEQQDEYIALLLAREQGSSSEVPDLPKDASGYTQHPDNAFAQLLTQHTKPKSS